MTPLTKMPHSFAISVATTNLVKSDNTLTPRFVIVYPGMDRWIAVTAASPSLARRQANTLAKLIVGARVIEVNE